VNKYKPDNNGEDRGMHTDDIFGPKYIELMLPHPYNRGWETELPSELRALNDILNYLSKLCDIGKGP
jgi:hypothetical protein